LTRWNKRIQVDRPEFPKLVPMCGSRQDVERLMPALLRNDPEAEVVDGGSRGLFARVHNQEGEEAAKPHGEGRSFPIAAGRTW
jgi:hypothetical protein